MTRFFHVSNLIRLGVALKTSCNVIEMSHVATLEKDKSLDSSIFRQILTLLEGFLCMLTAF
jgi:hypothetical protein